KLFVGGIAWETSEESFRRYFAKYGEISDSVIMMDKVTGRPRGFGFVTFSDQEVAEKVLQQDHVIDGRSVEVKRTVPREEYQSRGVSKTKKIFVGGLPVSMNEDDLREYFSSYGTIVEHQIMLDHKTGRSRGFGFVTFDSEDAVEKVLSDGRMHELSGKQVEIKRAEPKRFSFEYAPPESRFRGASNSRSSVPLFPGISDGFGGSYGGKMGRGGYGGSFGGGYNGYGGGYGNFAGGDYGGGGGGFFSGGGGYGGYGYGYGGYGGGPMYGGGGFMGGYGYGGGGPEELGFGGSGSGGGGLGPVRGYG
ncbi:hypothetical protein M569_16592, partial [Genlisea aurea]